MADLKQNGCHNNHNPVNVNPGGQPSKQHLKQPTKLANQTKPQLRKPVKKHVKMTIPQLSDFERLSSSSLSSSNGGSHQAIIQPHKRCKESTNKHSYSTSKSSDNEPSKESINQHSSYKEPLKQPNCSKSLSQPDKQPVTCNYHEAFIRIGVHSQKRILTNIGYFDMLHGVPINKECELAPEEHPELLYPGYLDNDMNYTLDTPQDLVDGSKESLQDVMERVGNRLKVMKGVSGEVDDLNDVNGGNDKNSTNVQDKYQNRNDGIIKIQVLKRDVNGLNGEGVGRGVDVVDENGMDCGEGLMCNMKMSNDDECELVGGDCSVYSRKNGSDEILNCDEIDDQYDGDDVLLNGEQSDTQDIAWYEKLSSKLKLLKLEQLDITGGASSVESLQSNSSSVKCRRGKEDKNTVKKGKRVKEKTEKCKCRYQQSIKVNGIKSEHASIIPSSDNEVTSKDRLTTGQYQDVRSDRYEINEMSGQSYGEGSVTPSPSMHVEPAISGQVKEMANCREAHPLAHSTQLPRDERKSDELGRRDLQMMSEKGKLEESEISVNGQVMEITHCGAVTQSIDVGQTTPCEQNTHETDELNRQDASRCSAWKSDVDLGSAHHNHTHLPPITQSLDPPLTHSTPLHHTCHKNNDSTLQKFSKVSSYNNIDPDLGNVNKLDGGNQDSPAEKQLATESGFGDSGIPTAADGDRNLRCSGKGGEVEGLSCCDGGLVVVVAADGELQGQGTGVVISAGADGTHTVTSARAGARIKSGGRRQRRKRRESCDDNNDEHFRCCCCNCDNRDNCCLKDGSFVKKEGCSGNGGDRRKKRDYCYSLSDGYCQVCSLPVIKEEVIANSKSGHEKDEVNDKDKKGEVPCCTFHANLSKNKKKKSKKRQQQTQQSLINKTPLDSSKDKSNKTPKLKDVIHNKAASMLQSSAADMLYPTNHLEEGDMLRREEEEGNSNSKSEAALVCKSPTVDVKEKDTCIVLEPHPIGGSISNGYDSDSVLYLKKNKFGVGVIESEDGCYSSSDSECVEVFMNKHKSGLDKRMDAFNSAPDINKYKNGIHVKSCKYRTDSEEVLRNGYGESSSCDTDLNGSLNGFNNRHFDSSDECCCDELHRFKNHCGYHHHYGHRESHDDASDESSEDSESDCESESDFNDSESNCGSVGYNDFDDSLSDTGVCSGDTRGNPLLYANPYITSSESDSSPNEEICSDVDTSMDQNSHSVNIVTCDMLDDHPQTSLSNGIQSKDGEKDFKDSGVDSSSAEYDKDIDIVSSSSSLNGQGNVGTKFSVHRKREYINAKGLSTISEMLSESELDRRNTAKNGTDPIMSENSLSPKVSVRDQLCVTMNGEGQNLTDSGYYGSSLKIMTTSQSLSPLVHPIDENGTNAEHINGFFNNNQKVKDEMCTDHAKEIHHESPHQQDLDAHNGYDETFTHSSFKSNIPVLTPECHNTSSENGSVDLPHNGACLATDPFTDQYFKSDEEPIDDKERSSSPKRADLHLLPYKTLSSSSLSLVPHFREMDTDGNSDIVSIKSPILDAFFMAKSSSWSNIYREAWCQRSLEHLFSLSDSELIDPRRAEQRLLDVYESALLGCDDDLEEEEEEEGTSDEEDRFRIRQQYFKRSRSRSSSLSCSFKMLKARRAALSDFSSQPELFHRGGSSSSFDAFMPCAGEDAGGRSTMHPRPQPPHSSMQHEDIMDSLSNNSSLNSIQMSLSREDIMRGYFLSAEDRIHHAESLLRKKQHFRKTRDCYRPDCQIRLEWCADKANTRQINVVNDRTGAELAITMTNRDNSLANGSRVQIETFYQALTFRIEIHDLLHLEDFSHLVPWA